MSDLAMAIYLKRLDGKQQDENIDGVRSTSLLAIVDPFSFVHTLSVTTWQIDIRQHVAQHRLSVRSLFLFHPYASQCSLCSASQNIFQI